MSSVGYQRIFPSRSPSIRPEVDPLPATLKPISTGRTTTKSYKSLTSNSPPDSPPEREEQSTNVQWRGKAMPPSTPPRSAFKLPHHPPLRSPFRSPMRSPLRSPLHTPRSFWSETGTLKWLGRLDPGLSPKPDFSLPPNLVCHSETSSPVCSPPPQLDLDSPTKSTVISEPSEDLDTPHTTSIHLQRGGEEEENRLADFSNPPASTSFVNADDFLSLRHDSEGDYGDENVRQNEPQRMELSATSNSGPSHSSSSSLEGVRSSEAVGLEEFRVLTRVAEIEQLSVPIGGAVSNPSLPTTSWATVSAPDEDNASESHRGAEVDVDEADQSIEQSRVSLPREAEGSHELEIFSIADANVRSTDRLQASSSLLEEPESPSESEHTSGARVCVAAQRDQDLSNTSNDMWESIHERFDEADVSVAAHASENGSRSPLEKEDGSLDFELVNEADVGAAHANEKASPSPLENAEGSLDFELVNATDLVDAARFQNQLPLSPSQETLAGPNSAPVTAMDSSIGAQSNEEVLPSLLTPEPDNSDESAALDRAEVTAKVHSVDSSNTAQSNEEVLSSLSTPEADNRDESAALDRTEVTAKVNSMEQTATPPTSESEFRTTPNTKAALEAAIARHDRNMVSCPIEL